MTMHRSQVEAAGLPSRQVGQARDLWLGVGYFLAAAAALSFSRFENGVAIAWFATAFLVPWLALTRPRHWGRPIIYCAIASMVATALFGAGLAYALLRAAALMLEASIGALMLRHYLADGRYFDTIPRVGVFVALIGIVMPTASAFAGAAAVNLTLHIPFWNVWPDWLMAHSLGALTGMPIVTLMMRPDTRKRLREMRNSWNRIDWLLAALAISASILVFVQTRMPLLFLPMLPLTLLTLRHGRIGASGAIIGIALIGGVMTALGLGPVALFQGSPNEKVLFFQFFLAVCIVTALPMAAELNRRRFLTRRLQESEALFRLMADRSGDILFNISPQGVIRYVSPSISKIGGYAAERLRGTASINLVLEDDRALVRREHIRAIENPEETFVFEYRALTGDGRVVWFETHTRAMLDEKGKVLGVVSAARDVSHRKTLEYKLHDAASRDALTGLANRRVFDTQLGVAVAKSSGRRSAGCLVIADIDHFKRVNDQFGHPVGDLVLRAVSSAFVSELRATDTVCRIGGEEFGFILWDLSIEDGGALCERLLKNISGAPVVAGGSIIPVTISMGIVDIGGHDFADAVIAAADRALYEAKNNGRNRLAIAA